MGDRRVLWFSDTEYGLDATLRKVADLVSCLSHPETVLAINIDKIA
jgi:hypothetical protein